MNDYKRWLRHAEEDLNASKLLFKNEFNPWIVIYHAQQAVEKFLKAMLIYYERPFKKTHDVIYLLNELIKVDSDFKKLTSLNLVLLYPLAIQTRYPHEMEYSYKDAEEAIKLAAMVKEFIMKKLEKEKNK